MTEAEKTHSKETEQPRVVIVGGGFGGLCAARGLAGAPVSVTLIDKRNYHLFRPMLYQVATGLLSADQISGPLRSIPCRQANVEVLLDEVSGVDTDKRLVRLKQRKSEFTFIRALYNRMWFKFSSHLFLNWQQQDSGFAN